MQEGPCGSEARLRNDFIGAHSTPQAKESNCSAPSSSPSQSMSMQSNTTDAHVAENTQMHTTTPTHTTRTRHVKARCHASTAHHTVSHKSQHGNHDLRMYQRREQPVPLVNLDASRDVTPGFASSDRANGGTASTAACRFEGRRYPEEDASSEANEMMHQDR